MGHCISCQDFRPKKRDGKDLISEHDGWCNCTQHRCMVSHIAAPFPVKKVYGCIFHREAKVEESDSQSEST